MNMRACLIPFALLCFAGATAYSQGLYAPAPYLIDGNTLVSCPSHSISGFCEWGQCMSSGMA